MIIIGEKINATRKSIAKAIHSHDKEAIKTQIEKQDKAGAHYIDLNAGTGTGDKDKEISDMKWLIDIAFETTEKSLSIDSDNPDIIEKAAEYINKKRPWIINSVKNDDHILDSLLPLAAEHGAGIIALAMGAEGIPNTPEDRLLVCHELHKKTEKAGIPEDKIFFDPLVMPISASYGCAKITLDTLTKVKKEFPGAKTTMGVSNVAFGLLKRSKVNGALIISAITHGLDSAICDPTKKSIRQAILLGELISGKDRHCRKYIRAVRNGEFDEPKKSK
ncbi:MAG: dihydropteroate synthase [Candidatus Aminicenantaceae bacterium]